MRSIVFSNDVARGYAKQGKVIKIKKINMKKYIILMFLLMLGLENQTLKANSAEQSAPFKGGYNFQQTETPLPGSETNPFVKSNNAFNTGVNLRGDTGEDDFNNDGGTNNRDDLCVDCGVPLNNGVGVFLLLMLAYSTFLFWRKKVVS
jgi:hypothetical protein